MYFHREGHRIIIIATALVVAICVAMIVTTHTWTWVHYLLVALLAVLELFVVRFFRIPKRIFNENDQQLIAPADGTIVTIEETYEREYLKEECIQLSIFMSINDVHVNRYPCDGVVEYVNHSHGNYFVASHPKASELNERTSIGLRLPNGSRILIRQVAGAVARRIACYAVEGQHVKQNQELGFIRFGSRVDIFMPKSFEVGVDLEEHVSNAITPIATIHQ